MHPPDPDQAVLGIGGPSGASPHPPPPLPPKSAPNGRFDPQPAGGSEFKYCPRPNRLWGHSKGPLGGPEPHISGPIFPCIRPERGKPLFWPLDVRAPQRVKKMWRNGAKPEPATGTAGGDARGALGIAGGMGRAELMPGFVVLHST